MDPRVYMMGYICENIAKVITGGLDYDKY